MGPRRDHARQLHAGPPYSGGLRLRLISPVLWFAALEQTHAAWLVFLCFGSKGSVDKVQVGEVADGLERSGHRFLCSAVSQISRALGPARH